MTFDPYDSSDWHSEDGKERHRASLASQRLELLKVPTLLVLAGQLTIALHRLDWERQIQRDEERRRELNAEASKLRNEMQPFKRQLGKLEVMSALAEYLHRRGQKMDTDAGYSVRLEPGVDVLEVVVTVEQCEPAIVNYEPKV
jgi:hypothetical protein